MLLVHEGAGQTEFKDNVQHRIQVLLSSVLEVDASLHAGALVQRHVDSVLGIGSFLSQEWLRGQPVPRHLVDQFALHKQLRSS